MENPYQSPESSPDIGAAQSGSPFADHIPVGRASQVPLVAILMMVQGGFELLFAVLLLVMAVVMPTSMMAGAAGGPAPAQGPSPAVMASVIGGVYLVLGALVSIAGVLKLTAGFRNYRYRGRTLGIVALFSGLATVFGCYCFPTALALLIYGLIVYFDRQTVYAFELGRQGQTPEQIKACLERFR
ncbi:MAG TPA: hypothetical protein VGN42_01065 [Pirellulales bacterium]|jgi:hypothetical protein|nr:hypothetical protein [Pirellulales bacterium]